MTRIISTLLTTAGLALLGRRLIVIRRQLHESANLSAGPMAGPSRVQLCAR